MVDEAILEDAFVRGFHNVPDDEALRRMTPLQLHELSSQSEPGSLRHRMIEQEMTRRREAEESYRAWLSIFIKFGSLILAIIAFAKMSGWFH